MTNFKLIRLSHTDIFKSFRIGEAEIRHQSSSSDGSFEEKASMLSTKFSVLESKLSELSNLVALRARPTFDNSFIEICDHDIQHLSHDISSRISNIKTTKFSPSNIQDAPIYYNLQQIQMIRLRRCILQFREIQSSIQHEDFEDDNPISKIYADFTPQVSADQLALLNRTNEAIQVRNSEISSLVDQMNEINDLLRDVSVLVFEQGSVLDRIDTKIEVSFREIITGNEELVEANEYQSGRFFYIYIIIVAFLIVACLVILVIRKKHK